MGGIRKQRLTKFQKKLVGLIREQGGLVLLTKGEDAGFTTSGGLPVRRDTKDALVRLGMLIPQNDGLLGFDTQSWRVKSDTGSAASVSNPAGTNHPGEDEGIQERSGSPETGRAFGDAARDPEDVA